MKNYIYCHEPMWNKKGGTVGYLSHLKTGMNKIGKFDGQSGVNHNFIFPSKIHAHQFYSDFDMSVTYPEIATYKTGGTSPFVDRKRRLFDEIPPNESMLKIDLNNITSMHIHGHYSFLPVYNFLRLCGLEDKVVKILTTHNPIKPSLEDLAYDGGRTKLHEMEDFHFIHNYRDEFAFSKADALLFPCEEAMEPYFQTWPEFRNLIKGKPIYFSITGAIKSDVVTPRAVLRRDLNIPADATVFLYIGRFMAVRGIQTFVDAAKRTIEKGSKCYFVAVGDDVPAPFIDSPYWIQLGFTQYPADYMAMADCCVIASNHNYFDLGMIEILAQSVPLIAAETGGCRYLGGRTSGVLYFEPGSSESLSNAMEKFLSVGEDSLDLMKSENGALYSNEFTSEHFAEGYLQTMDVLYQDFRLTNPVRSIVRLPFVKVSSVDMPFPHAKPPVVKANSAFKTSVRLSSVRRALKPIVRPFVKKLGNDSDVRKFDADPASFFASLRSQRYRSIGRVLFGA